MAGRVVAGVVVFARSVVLQRPVGGRFRALLSESPLRRSSSLGGFWEMSAAVGFQYVTVKLCLAAVVVYLGRAVVLRKVDYWGFPNVCEQGRQICWYLGSLSEDVCGLQNCSPLKPLLIMR